MSVITVQPRGFNVNMRTPAPVSEVLAPDNWLKQGIRVIVEHVSRHKVIYRIGALTLTMMLAGEVAAFADPVVGDAATVSPIGDSSGIDAGATHIYKRLISVGKWIIIIKGAFDTISATVQQDFVSARKSGLSYMMVYCILLGLPWAFKQIEILFEGI